MFGCRRSCAKLYGTNSIKCSIILEDNPQKELVPWNQTKICGTVVLEPETRFEIKNLWIQLEGIAISRFIAKINRVSSNVFQSHHFLPPSMTSFAFGAPELSRCKPKSLEPGKHRFQFELTPARVPYPTSFKTPYGFIQYRIAVYLNNNFAECANQGYSWELKNLLATQTLSCKGYRDFQSEEAWAWLRKSVEAVGTSETSSTRRMSSKSTLTLDKGGYKCGERAKFSLYVENTVCDHISKLTLELVHQVTYYGNPATATKSTVAVLRKLDKLVDTADGEIVWDGELTIPRNLMPSFSTDTKCIDIAYAVQFTAVTNERILLKGERAIVIGTADGVSCGPSKLSKNRDALDTVSVASLPCYSALSSRRSSVETLPPCYEDALKLDELSVEEGGMRPRSNSQVT